MIVPAGARHNVINTGAAPLQALHDLRPARASSDGVVHKTREQAEADHANDHWDGETSE